MPKLEHEKIVAIVDPYSSGRLLAPEFLARGYRCIRVQSAATIPEVYCKSLDDTCFDDRIIHDGDLEKTLFKLRALGVSCVIPGVETGVELADQLSEALGLLSNGTAMSAARRDKFLMAEALGRNDVRHIPQLRSDQLPEVLNWLSEHKYYPAVLKPINSAGSDSVLVCTNESDVRQAFAAILGKTNKLDLRNEYVLAQPFIAGTEFIVDAVSCRGKHFVCDIWRYKKSRVNDAAFVYDAVELLDPQDPEAIALSAYIQQVLSALEIQYGPSHSEVIIDARGPVLVEMGARVSGGDASVITSETTGHSQVDLTVEAYFEAEKFLGRLSQTYERRKCALAVYIISQQEGVLQAWPLFDRIEALPSLHSYVQFRKPGQRVQKTVDIFSTPAMINLVHSDPQLLWQDYEHIRQLEARGLFTVSAS